MLFVSRIASAAVLSVAVAIATDAARSCLPARRAVTMRSRPAATPTRITSRFGCGKSTGSFGCWTSCGGGPPGLMASPTSRSPHLAWMALRRTVPWGRPGTRRSAGRVRPPVSHPGRMCPAACSAIASSAACPSRLAKSRFRRERTAGSHTPCTRGCRSRRVPQRPRGPRLPRHRRLLRTRRSPARRRRPPRHRLEAGPSSSKCVILGVGRREGEAPAEPSGGQGYLAGMIHPPQGTGPRLGQGAHEPDARESRLTCAMFWAR